MQVILGRWWFNLGWFWILDVGVWHFIKAQVERQAMIIQPHLEEWSLIVEPMVFYKMFWQDQWHIADLGFSFYRGFVFYGMPGKTSCPTIWGDIETCEIVFGWNAIVKIVFGPPGCLKVQKRAKHLLSASYAGKQKCQGIIVRSTTEAELSLWPRVCSEKSADSRVRSRYPDQS